MSRTSLNKRLAIVREAMREKDPFAYRAYHLPPHLRVIYDAWTNECDTLRELYSAEPGSYYEAILDGLATPPMPRCLIEPLGINDGQHSIPVGATLADATAIYERFLEGDRR